MYRLFSDYLMEKLWYRSGFLMSFATSPDMFGRKLGYILMVLTVILCMALPYLLGSVNTSIVFSKKKHNEDIRDFGSGNAGMTNIMRKYGKKEALFIFLLDFLKGVVSFIFGLLLYGYIGSQIAGLFCILGHIFPCFYKFKGGKGIAVTCSVCFMTDYISFGILIALFLAIVIVTKYVSLGSVVCVAAYPIVLRNRGFSGTVCLIAMLIAAVCIFKHKDNIKRISRGEENKTYLFKNKKENEN